MLETKTCRLTMCVDHASRLIVAISTAKDSPHETSERLAALLRDKFVARFAPALSNDNLTLKKGRKFGPDMDALIEDLPSHLLSEALRPERGVAWVWCGHAPQLVEGLELDPGLDPNASMHASLLRSLTKARQPAQGKVNPATEASPPDQPDSAPWWWQQCFGSAAVQRDESLPPPHRQAHIKVRNTYAELTSEECIAKICRAVQQGAAALHCLLHAGDSLQSMEIALAEGQTEGQPVPVRDSMAHEPQEAAWAKLLLVQSHDVVAAALLVRRDAPCRVRELTGRLRAVVPDVQTALQLREAVAARRAALLAEPG